MLLTNERIKKILARVFSPCIRNSYFSLAMSFEIYILHTQLIINILGKYLNATHNLFILYFERIDTVF